MFKPQPPPPKPTLPQPPIPPNKEEVVWDIEDWKLNNGEYDLDKIPLKDGMKWRVTINEFGEYSVDLMQINKSYEEDYKKYLSDIEEYNKKIYSYNKDVEEWAKKYNIEATKYMLGAEIVTEEQTNKLKEITQISKTFYSSLKMLQNI